VITVDTVKQMIAGAIADLRTRLRGMVLRGVVKALEDGAGLQLVQLELRAGELVPNLEVLTPHGFTSRAPLGSEAIAFCVNGNPNNRVVLCFNRGTRLKGVLEEGEAAMHIGVAGQMVRLLADGGVEIKSATASGASAVLKENGDVAVVPGAGGNLYLGQDGALKKVALADDVEDRLDAIKTAYNTHTHTGVTVGPGSSGTTAAVIPVLAPVGSDNVYGKG
jgi:phage gp45-like